MGGIGSILFGMVIGGILMVANTYIFGRESINFTGLPLLVSSLSTNKPIYACGQIDPNQPLPIVGDDPESCDTSNSVPTPKLSLTSSINNMIPTINMKVPDISGNIISGSTNMF
jgi:hypothetical protein